MTPNDIDVWFMNGASLPLLSRRSSYGFSNFSAQNGYIHYKLFHGDFSQLRIESREIRVMMHIDSDL